MEMGFPPRGARGIPSPMLQVDTRCRSSAVSQGLIGFGHPYSLKGQEIKFLQNLSLLLEVPFCIRRDQEILVGQIVSELHPGHLALRSIKEKICLDCSLSESIGLSFVEAFVQSVEHISPTVCSPGTP